MEELLHDGGDDGESATYRKDALCEVGWLSHLRLDNVIKDSKAAQLQSEPLNVYGEQNGTTGGGGELSELIHTSLNCKAQILAV